MSYNLRQDIDDFVQEALDGYVPRIPPSPKVIHDPIWGTNEFLRHEIALIDSPIFQRLRRVYQTGLSFFTFPSTTQTRFEHSLGATVVAAKMVAAIKQRHTSRIDDSDLFYIRFAALLHDCGHGFSSHASEEVYKWHPDIEDARNHLISSSSTHSVREKIRDAKASELLSWHIVTAPAFQQLIDQINEQCDTTLTADRIANLILGIPFDERTYLAEIINGPFDVDRVDYTIRDSDYSGMKAGIDLERFFHDIDISLCQDGHVHLVLHSTHAIEQLLFAKVHLFVRLYRHQKVLAADAAVQSLPALVIDSGTTFNGVNFQRVSDFLRITDIDILGAWPANYDPTVAALLDLK